MQAVVQDGYGAPEVLQNRELAQPTIGRDQVLVRVEAASLHIGNSFAVRGSPLLMRAFTGLRRPKNPVPGFDLAGRVTAVGPEVSSLRVGDEVFGTGVGSCAEYAVASSQTLVRKPAAVTFEEAAAIPTSALAALHGLRDAGRLQAGQKVLINGASGGVGTFAVQIAKALGAHVTGVCSTRNLDLVRSLGADRVFDYTRQDFTEDAARYDLIFDNVENRSLAECRRALTPSGTLVLNSGTGATGLSMLIRLIRPMLLSPFVSQRLTQFLSRPNQADLALLSRLVEEGAVRPVVDRSFPLLQTAAALRHIETGHARGQVVIAVTTMTA